MVHPLIRPCALALAGLLAGPAWAQPADAGAPATSTPASTSTSTPASTRPAAAADPADARAAVPALVWRSTFTQPDGIGLPPALGWKQANDQVQRIGGWRAYAREAAEPAAAAASAPARPGAGHSGHGAGRRP